MKTKLPYMGEKGLGNFFKASYQRNFKSPNRVQKGQLLQPLDH